MDNKSTDDSPQVIANLELSYLELNVIREPDNLGQSAACVDGFHKSRGQYVVFVDADDYYFETFAETHFLVHLTLPNAVGFTSSEMMQVVGNSVVLGNVMTVSGTPFRSQCHVVEIDESLALAKAQEVGLCRPAPWRTCRSEVCEEKQSSGFGLPPLAISIGAMLSLCLSIALNCEHSDVPLMHSSISQSTRSLEVSSLTSR